MVSFCVCAIVAWISHRQDLGKSGFCFLFTLKPHACSVEPVHTFIIFIHCTHHSLYLEWLPPLLWLLHSVLQILSQLLPPLETLPDPPELCPVTHLFILCLPYYWVSSWHVKARILQVLFIRVICNSLYNTLVHDRYSVNICWTVNNLETDITAICIFH